MKTNAVLLCCFYSQWVFFSAAKISECVYWVLFLSSLLFTFSKGIVKHLILLFASRAIWLRIKFNLASFYADIATNCEHNKIRSNLMPSTESSIGLVAVEFSEQKRERKKRHKHTLTHPHNNRTIEIDFSTFGWIFNTQTHTKILCLGWLLFKKNQCDTILYCKANENVTHRFSIGTLLYNDIMRIICMLSGVVRFSHMMYKYYKGRRFNSTNRQREGESYMF